MMADEFAELQKGKAPRPGPCGFDSLAPIFMAEFERAKSDRRAIEERWLMDLRQFKGRYDRRRLDASGIDQKAFAKRTQTKVRTANARMMDLLFLLAVIETTSSRTRRIRRFRRSSSRRC